MSAVASIVINVFVGALFCVVLSSWLPALGASILIGVVARQRRVALWCYFAVGAICGACVCLGRARNIYGCGSDKAIAALQTFAEYGGTLGVVAGCGAAMLSLRRPPREFADATQVLLARTTIALSCISVIALSLRFEIRGADSVDYAPVPFGLGAAIVVVIVARVAGSLTDRTIQRWPRAMPILLAAAVGCAWRASCVVDVANLSFTPITGAELGYYWQIRNVTWLRHVCEVPKHPKDGHRLFY